MQVSVDHQAMGIIGYTVPWCAKAGELVTLHLSAEQRPQQIELIRLDLPVEQRIELPLMQTRDARPTHRQFQQGSFLMIATDERGKAGPVSRLDFQLLLTRNDQRRVIFQLDGFTAWLEGTTIELEQDGHTLLSIADVPGQEWLALHFECADGFATLRVTSSDLLAPFQVEQRAVLAANVISVTGLLFGSDAEFTTPCLNARFARIRLASGADLFAWDFPTILPDAPLLAHSGEKTMALQVIGLPTFCVTSSRWDGSTFDPRVKPAHYDAVHCHDDDLGPLDWPASVRLHLPDDLASGIYAFRVTAGAQQEDIVFFVRQLQPSARLVFLVPTATYLAYADEFLPPHLYQWQCDDRGHRMAQANRFKSLYDYHGDLSGVSICSYKKPKATLRPDYHYPLGDCPHNLPVDLEFLRFCRRHAIEVDVITDHDLHFGGLDLLKSYAGVLTGSHPEYMSVEMEATLRQFVADGGNLAYLGGNGFATTVAFRDDLMELRRSPLEAGRTWDAPIGELNFALTNEPGGYLRGRGKGEFSLTGVAISLMGFDPGRPFQRCAAGHDAKNAWLFAGVESEIFGETGRVLGAAASYEVDATDRRLGTAGDVLVVARADGFPDSFYHDPSRWYAGGESEMQSRRCAEMTMRYLPSGGSIFCASSVGWLGALPEGDAMNDVGRITLNVLHRFAGIV